MALSTIVRKECAECGKTAIEKSRSKFGKTTFILLACGHSVVEVSAVSDDETVYDKFQFADGGKLREYQIDAVKFAEAAGFKCIIADEQGLGKTKEFLSLVKLHPEKLLPACLVVPSTVKIQWLHEIINTCGAGREYLTQVIQSGKERAMPGFAFYVITYDMLKNPEIWSLLPDKHVKTLMIDECQRIKNHLSERAKAVQKFRKNVDHVIAMSGTPIKNNAGEYFTVLNLVDHLRFPQYQRFLDNYCDYYDSGWGPKVGGLKNAEQFHNDTRDIIIRRTKNEVLKDLPSIERKFYHVELDRKLNKAYAKALDELDDMLYNDEVSEFDRSTNKIAIMQRMRHITGISKTAECVDFTQEFLESTDRKIVIFTHHQDVAAIILQKLNNWFDEDEQKGKYGKVLHLHSGLDSQARQNLVMQFKDDDKARVMIASTLAAGEGLNLQFCSDAVMLERQWNPANEEQGEARFHRFGQKNNVSITYMLASGTIDEYFTELVEIKRSIVASTMDNKEIEWNQQSLMSELAQILVTKGRDKWKL